MNILNLLKNKFITGLIKSIFLFFILILFSQNLCATEVSSDQQITRSRNGYVAIDQIWDESKNCITSNVKIVNADSFGARFCCRNLSALNNIVELDLGKLYNPEVIHNISPCCKNLKYLHLRETSSQVVQAVSIDLRSLHSLIVFGARLSTFNLQLISQNLVDLKSLGLASCHVRDTGAKFLTKERERNNFQF